MNFKKKLIPLNINLTDVVAAHSVPFMLPPCNNFSLQIFSALSKAAATIVSLQQSNDGNNFDQVTDAAGTNVEISLSSATPTFTLNVSNLATVWLRLLVTPPAGEAETGAISYLILSSN